VGVLFARLFAFLHSTWLNGVRARRVREGKGFVDTELVLFTDGTEIETNIFVGQVLNAVHRRARDKRTIFRLQQRTRRRVHEL
jgi:RNA polymerase sigma-70 factor, ECF subfamily